jgi:tetratricopeptide (TPR) repeat protein
MNNLGFLYANGQGVVQDYVKAREWYEKAADSGNALAMTNLGVLYANGLGVAQDFVKARELFEKGAAQGDARADAMLKQLVISVAAAGRYAEALQLREKLAAEDEAVETKREGKPGEDTAKALNEVAWYSLFARDFKKALTAADRAHTVLPDNLLIETNRAHALMFLGREEEAKALYLAYKDRHLSDDTSWESAVAGDFAEFRKAGLTHPVMADVENELGISR